MNKFFTLLFVLLLSLATNSFGQGWTQIGVDIEGEAAGNNSGYSVSLSSDGSIVAIGAYKNGGNGIDAGHVRVYQNISGTWIQMGNDIDGEAAGDQSGYSVSLSSDGLKLVIGAHRNDENGLDAGHVRFYNYYSGIWSQLGSDIDGEAADDYSGFSISLSSNGSIVAIGAPMNGGNGPNAGHVRIYQRTPQWIQIGDDIDGEAEDDYFGHSVDLNADGTIVAIGAEKNDGNGSTAGHVRVYQNISGTWTQIGDDIDGEPYDWSGSSVSLNSNGSIVAIGAFGGGSANEGHVKVYENISGNWTQIGNTIDGETTWDASGTSVSLSSDGSVVAIGAPENPNGSNIGHVRIYRNISGIWTQIGDDIDGEAIGDECGTSVSLSSDGSIVAIGAPNNDGNGSDAGHVRIYSCLVYAPVAIAATDVNITSFVANWNASTDAAGYYLDVDDNSNFSSPLAGYNNLDAGNVLSYNITGLTAEKTYYYRVRAYNIPTSNNSNTISLTTLSKIDQHITFDALATKTYGEIDFTLSATGGDSGNPIVFYSSDETIATCSGTNGETITIINAGTCSIYANQEGNSYFNTALQVQQTLTVNPMNITVTVDTNQTKEYSEIDPFFTYTSNSDLLSGDSFTGTLSREHGESVGIYTITQNSLSAGPNYNITFIGADFKITKATPVIIWSNPADIHHGTALSDIQLNATANINGFFQYSPASGTILETGNNQELSVIFTPTDVINYNMTNETGFINVLQATGISDLLTNSISIKPNPTSGIVMLESENRDIQQISIFNMAGKKIIEKTNVQQNEIIDLSGYENGIFIINIQIDEKILTTKIKKE